MRRLPVRSECADAVIVMDAFGFFDTEEEHDAILREDARVLMTGGRLTVVLNWPPGKPKKRSLALQPASGGCRAALLFRLHTCPG